MSKTILILAIALLCSCNNDRGFGFASSTGKQQSMEFEEQQIEAPRTTKPLPPPPAFKLEKGSKIIKTGNLKFEVVELERSKQQVDSLLIKYEAFYENEAYQSHRTRNNYSLNIRIPSANYDVLINDLENGIGTLVSKNIKAKDVTEEYVDLKIRMENNLAYLAQYKSILTKAKSIQEILEVQEKIRVIEEEIESKKGRLQFLDDQVKYSTLDLVLTELNATRLANQPSFGRKITNAFKSGVEGFLNFIITLVNLWPFLILVIILFIFRNRFSNPFRK